ncbi:MAG TPA: hypothetical protein VML54_13545 [Candidatus Limnocylindrales bacterium]|nr:hypothetical protein [Candidatus Limnocylindrales bacterium]
MNDPYAGEESPDRAGAASTRRGRGRLAVRLVAEFAVIVIGVLVALAVDSFREDRQEQRILEEALGDIASQIRDQHYTLGVMHGRVLPGKMASLERLVRFLREDGAPLQDTLLLVADMSNAMGAAHPWFASDRYEALRSSGLLRLLRDRPLSEELAGTFAGFDLLLDQADRYQSDFARVAAEILPMELAPRFHPMAGYGRDFNVPALTGPARLDAFITEVRRSREELLPPAQAEVWATAAKWTAVGRIRYMLADALQELEPWDPDPPGPDFELGMGPVHLEQPDGRIFAPDSTPGGYAEGRFTGTADLGG